MILSMRECLALYDALKILDGNRRVRQPNGGGEVWAPEVPKRRRHWLPIVDVAIIRNTKRLEPLVKVFFEERTELATRLGIGAEDEEGGGGEKAVAWRLGLEGLLAGTVEVDLQTCPASALGLGKNGTLRRWALAVLWDRVFTDDLARPSTEPEEQELTVDVCHTLWEALVALDQPVVVEGAKEGESRVQEWVLKEAGLVGLVRNMAVLQPIAALAETRQELAVCELNPKNTPEDGLPKETVAALRAKRRGLMEERVRVRLQPVALEDLQLERNEGLSRCLLGTLEGLVVKVE